MVSLAHWHKILRLNMASQHALKMPPVLVGEEAYSEWLNDLKIW